VAWHRQLRATLVRPSASVSWAARAKTSTALGAATIVMVWIVVDFLVGVTYGIYRLARRG